MKSPWVSFLPGTTSFSRRPVGFITSNLVRRDSGLEPSEKELLGAGGAHMASNHWGITHEVCPSAERDLAETHL